MRPPRGLDLRVLTGNPQLKSLLLPRWRALTLLSATSILGGLFEAAFLVTITRAAFAIADNSSVVQVTRGYTLSISEVTVLSLALVIGRVLSAVLSSWLAARLSSSVSGAIRKELALSFLRADWPSQQSSRSGYLQELLTSFAQQGAYLITGTGHAIRNGFSLVTLLAGAVIIDPLASLVVVGAVLILGLALQPLRKAISRQAGAATETSADFAGSLSEISQLGMEMHVFGVQTESERAVTTLIEAHQSTQRRLQFLQGLAPALYTGMAYMAIVISLAIIGSAENNDLAAVGGVMLIMLRSLSYGQGLQNSLATVSASLPFLEKLDLELQRYTAARATTGEVEVRVLGEIEATSVSFAYDDTQPVLQHLDFTIRPREVVGIVGPSGGGKSTLVQLLLGLRSPGSGRITASGVDIQRISRSSWNRLVTFVPQDAHLISGSVAENIRFMRDRVSQAEIERAATLASLHDEILTWEGGYQRDVGQQGAYLSGGQQQRLVIARALVERPDLLVLDEPTSSLDVKSESAIRETLSRLKEHMSIIIIAHRLSTLDICDRIMVIQDGEIKAFDTPSTLASQSEFYAEALKLSGLA